MNAAPGYRRTPEEHQRWQQAVAKHPPVRHPAIRTHPVSGRKALFVNEGFTTRLLGVSEKESDALLNYLFAHVWHTDVTFIETPPAIALLAAKLLPESGGDTLWSSGIAAYETLSEPVKQLLSGLQAEHDFKKSFQEYMFEQLYHGLLRHQVLFLRNQVITPQQQRALAVRFGDLHIHPVYPHAAGVEEIIELDTHQDNPPDNDICGTGGYRRHCRYRI
ncbi:hypothetical protein CRX72_26115 [Pantoea sp. BRM17]|nr:hypothetical protein CRX72_26115 [Pantoea sp. BRM17]